MKYLILLFALLTLACSPNQENRNKNDDNPSQQNANDHPFTGIYTYGPGADKGRTGNITIFTKNDSTLLFYVNLNQGPPAYNSGELFDTLRVKQNQAIYKGYTDAGGNDTGCKWQIDFYRDSLRVQTLDEAYDCGFGGNVIADGVYDVESHDIPKFVIKNQGDTLYFED